MKGEELKEKSNFSPNWFEFVTNDLSDPMRYDLKIPNIL